MRDIKKEYELFLAEGDYEREFKENSRVYVFYAKETGLTKIGISNQIIERFNRIRASSGLSLHHLLDITLEVGYDEKASMLEWFLHNFFKDKRVKGEWFNLNLKDVLMIRNLFWESVVGEDIGDYLKEELNNIKNSICSDTVRH